MAWGHWFTLANLFVALFISAFYLNQAHLPTSFIGLVYLFTNWIGHFAFLSLSCFILTIFPVIAVFPYKSHIRGVAAVIASFLQLFLFMDVLAYKGLGYHLTASSLSQLSKLEDVYRNAMGDGYWYMLLAVFIALLAYQLLVSNFTWKRIQQLQAFPYRYHLAKTLFALFVSSHIIHLWADATLYTDISKQDSLFPASYPLTAKGLLARYNLIDMNEYQESKHQQRLNTKDEFIIQPMTAVNCDVEDKPKLKIKLINDEYRNEVIAWLDKNNVSFQYQRQLSLSSDFDTTLFNFSTGYPGLYQYAKNHHHFRLNRIFQQDMISVEFQTHEFDQQQDYESPTSKAVYIFYDAKQQELFYRAHTILVGFAKLDALPFTPQNIIASYLEEGLDCKSYVTKNLIDVSLSDLNSESILTNYANGYLQLVYKDKSMLFSQGQLIKNRAFSTQKPIDEPLNILAIQQAIENITKKRQMIHQSLKQFD